jgi:hypothetical protein
MQGPKLYTCKGTGKGRDSTGQASSKLSCQASDGVLRIVCSLFKGGKISFFLFHAPILRAFTSLSHNRKL